MKKTFVLDTNVLLHDPNALYAFDDNHIIIPIYVIEEIDTFKKDLSELGRNARHVARQLDDLRANGNITEGVKLPDSEGSVAVAITERDLPSGFKTRNSTDNMIVATALEIGEKNGDDQPVIFVSKDVNLRIRAAALGLRAEDYDSEGTDIKELYSGISTVEVSGESIDAFYRDNELPFETENLISNQYALLQDPANPTHTALGKVNTDDQVIRPIVLPKEGMWGIRPRNKEQSFAADLLLNDDIKMVSLVGKAGTGKTLLAIAAGLHKVTEEGIYQRLLVSRPIFPLGRDIGYLPGDVEEKLTPWMQPIFDNIEFLMGISRQDKRQGRSYTELMDLGILEIEPLTYIRGRSIPNQYMIVDEAQNLTPHEVKTILSRAGDNTKIVLTGDPYQIDNPYVDSTNNGLVHVVNRFQSERIAGHVSLSKGERSDLAELAANLL